LFKQELDNKNKGSSTISKHRVIRILDELAGDGLKMKTLSDKISDGALCEYGNVLLIEDVKQRWMILRKRY